MKSLLATLVIILVLYNQSHAQLDFQAVKTIPNLGLGSNVNLADLDGDGDLDVIVSTEINPVLFALFNDAGNISAVPILITPPFSGNINSSYTIPFTIGDFDNDGKAEVVEYNLTSAASTQRLSIYEFDGEKFIVAKTLTTPNTNSTHSVVQGDFNKDGKLDIVYIADKLYEYESNSTDGYTPKTILTPEIIPFKCFISDIDNDTWPDIIVHDNNFKISIYRNDKTGGFTFNQSLGASVPLIREIFVVDLNNDNLKDILLQGYNQSYVDLFLQNPNGSYGSDKINFPATTGGGLDVTDLNNDNKPDIIMAGQYNDPTTQFGFIFLINEGSGFTYSFYSESSLTPWDIQISNLNGDSKKEIVTLNSGRNILIHEFDQGNVIANKNIPFTYTSDKATVKDMNKDGLEDIIVTNVFSNSLSLLYNKGDGSYGEPQYLLTEGPPNGVGVADFNNDSFNDIVYSRGQSPTPIGLFLSDSEGKLGESISYPGSTGNDIVINDFNKDGNMDLYNGTSVYYGVGDGTFIFYSPGIFNIISYTTGDYNQDGFGDLAIATISGLTILHGKNGYVLDFAQNILTNQSVSDISSGYLNSDQFLDLLIIYNNGSISQFNNGANEIFTEKILTVTGNVTKAITADFNKDTYPDIAILVDSNKITLLSGTANGEFQFYKDFLTTPYYYNQLQLSKINSDSFDDIILLESGNYPIGFLINDLVIEPTQNPVNLITSNLTDKKVTLSFTSGNGNGRIVIIREDSNPASLPVDNTFYVADTKYGSGTKLGADNFVVLADNKSGVDITDLKENTNYTINVYEYATNSKKIIINYLTTSSGAITFKTKKSQTITPPSIPAKTIGDPSFDLNIITSSGLPATIEIISGGATVNNTNITLINPGSVKLRLLQPGDIDFAPAPVVETLFCINPALPKITYTASANGKYILTSSSITNNIWLKNNAILNGEINQTIEVNPDGAYTVKVDYTGCSNTSSAVSNQSISFASITTKEEGDSDFTLTATASSTLAVSFEVISGGIILNNTIAKVSSAGPAKIKASQVGNSEFFPASSAEQAFCINPKKPLISSTNSEPGKFTLSSSSDVNNVWLRNNNPIAGATNKTYEPVEDGVYSVKVDYDGCFNISSPTTNLITGLKEMSDLSFYPNPSSDKIFITWPNQDTEIDKIIILDSQGKQSIAPYDHQEGQIIVDLQQMSTGVFTIILRTSHGTVFKRFIKY